MCVCVVVVEKTELYIYGRATAAGARVWTRKIAPSRQSVGGGSVGTAAARRETTTTRCGT